MIQNAKEPMGFVYSMAAAQLFYFMYGHDPPLGPLCILWVKHKNFFPNSSERKTRSKYEKSI